MSNRPTKDEIKNTVVRVLRELETETFAAMFQTPGRGTNPAVSAAFRELHRDGVIVKSRIGGDGRTQLWKLA